MAGLQRSEVSFRRQGSSGLVWDDKFLSGELKKINTTGKEDPQEDNRNTRAEGKSSAYKTVNVEPSYDPPSPKVSGCGVCGMFGKPAASKSHNRKHGHRK